MKRFLLFVGDTYYPGGGWDDFVGDCHNIEDIKTLKNNITHPFDWYQIVDTAIKKEITIND